MEENEMIIRHARVGDAEALASFNLALAVETEQMKLDRGVVLSGVRGLISDPDKGFYLVAQIDGEPAGMLMVTKEWSDWRNGNYWWIQSLFVMPSCRRRGAFKALYGQVKQMAKSKGEVCGLRVYVDRRNSRARETYEKLGMQRTDYEVYEDIFLEYSGPGGRGARE